MGKKYSGSVYTQSDDITVVASFLTGCPVRNPGDYFSSAMKNTLNTSPPLVMQSNTTYNVMIIGDKKKTGGTPINAYLTDIPIDDQIGDRINAMIETSISLHPEWNIDFDNETLTVILTSNAGHD